MTVFRDWERVGRSMREVEERLETAENAEQYQSVGHLCREALISLAQTAYEPAAHKSTDGVAPSDTDAKRMLDAYVDSVLSGSANDEARRFAKAAVALAVALQHRRSATKRDAELCFVATDAPVEQGFLGQALREAVDASFNMIDVDGDQSTNDTVLVLANGAAGGAQLGADSEGADAFREALVYVCTALGKELVRDGEGAQRLIEAVVEGAETSVDARTAARDIAGSLLVKAMVHGRDPNWGRIMMALGKSRIQFDESRVDLFINDIHIVHGGVAIPYLKDAVISAMSVPEVQIRVNVNAGDATATAWGCDLSEEYVILNSAYSS